MATAIHSTARTEGRRRGDTFAAAVMTPELRAEIGAKVEAFLEEVRRAQAAADFLIGFLDAADRPTLDMEPDRDGEAEPDEDSAQPASLYVRRAPDRVIRPTTAEQRAAYHHTGGRVPRNLRRGLFRECFA